MTVIENYDVELEFSLDDLFGDQLQFQKIRPRHEGHMPCGRDMARSRARHRCNADRKRAHSYR